MTRMVTVGAAQLGPIARAETRREVVVRLLALMRQAKDAGCDLVIYPELALTTFFPRWYMEDQREIDLAMIREIGYCNGIENYSRHFDGRQVDEPPYTLLDYFPHKADGTADEPRSVTTRTWFAITCMRRDASPFTNTGRSGNVTRRACWWALMTGALVSTASATTGT